MSESPYSAAERKALMRAFNDADQIGGLAGWAALLRYFSALRKKGHALRSAVALAMEATKRAVAAGPAQGGQDATQTASSVSK